MIEHKQALSLAWRAGGWSALF